MLRQRSRPYLFSNSVAPPILGASLKAIEICRRSTELRDRLEANTKFFRAAMTERKFNIVPGEHPIVPIMIGDAALAGKMAERLLAKGVYAIGFFYPGRAAGQGPRPRAGLGGPQSRRTSSSPSTRSPRCATSWDCESTDAQAGGNRKLDAPDHRSQVHIDRRDDPDRGSRTRS